MNVIILSAGEGSRFRHTHAVPKPLIPINGVPMITMAIKTFGVVANYFFVVKENDYLNRTLAAINDGCKNANIITVKETTEGAASSALLLETYIDTDEELIITNCDQIMNWDSNQALTCMREYDGAVVTYKDNDPKHSYAKIKNGLVEEIREKELISNNALTGIHYWARASYFFDSANRMIANDERVNNEFYIAPTYNYLISDGLDIGIFEVTDKEFYPVGTPKDLERYLNESR